MRFTMVNLIYLLGAGRSGTTLMSVVLHSCAEIQTLGEMHQFPEYLEGNKPCSCGNPLERCEFWSLVIAEREPGTNIRPEDIQFLQNAESHRHIPTYLMGKRSEKRYDTFQSDVLTACKRVSKKEWLLDSSKYISRFLLLNRNREISLKGIYVVRDVRGVIDSFGKNVQTPKGPLATLIYYGLINFFGELVYRLFPNVIKVKYEDFVRDPGIWVPLILEHLNGAESGDSGLSEVFDMPHIVGGNRMKSKRRISINPEEKWRSTLPRWKQGIYYISLWPLMLINGYKI